MATELLFQEDAYLRDCPARVVASGPEGIRLERTVFYATGGGQPGDSGRLVLEDGGNLGIQDTVKGEALDDILHRPASGAALPPVGAQVRAEIDWPRRHRLMRMHTCLHLISALVEGEISGAQISDGKGRVDFNLPDRPLDKTALQARLDRLIAEDRPVTPEWISEEELLARPDLIKTLTVRPPTGGGRVRLLRIEGIDLQPCGGTHVRSTGEIGAVEIGKIESKGKANRRINVLLRS